MSLVVMEPLASGIDRPWTLESYLKIGGYSSWRKVLAGELTREQIIDGV
jgi:NADH-quinone oxidoreductase subunit F